MVYCFCKEKSSWLAWSQLASLSSVKIILTNKHNKSKICSGIVISSTILFQVCICHRYSSVSFPHLWRKSKHCWQSDRKQDFYCVLIVVKRQQRLHNIGQATVSDIKKPRLEGDWEIYQPKWHFICIEMKIHEATKKWTIQQSCIQQHEKVFLFHAWCYKKKLLVSMNESTALKHIMNPITA